MIIQEEYEMLTELDDKWKWIARDGFKGELNVYNVRPTRSYFKNWWLTSGWFGRSKTILPYFFPFIQWTDSEPYFIPDLIKEYEKKKYRFRLGDSEMSDFVDNSSGESCTVFSLIVEEDEEMKKDKEWLREKVETYFSNWWSESDDDMHDLMDNVKRLIDQLDEPEVTLKKEPKYNVKFKVKSSFGTVGIFLYKQGDEVLAGDNFGAYYPKEDEFRLTEQEIRSFQNGDILFEHFAAKVEELEE